MFGGGLEPRAWRARQREPRGPGQSPWSGDQGGEASRRPPEAENLLASGCATEAANLPHSVRT